jgi:hypothetical protein
MSTDNRSAHPCHNVGESRIANNISRTAFQTIGMFNRRWRRLTQIRNLSPQTMGLGFKPSVVLRIGFIQIESVKSVVKKSAVGFGCDSAAPSSSVSSVVKAFAGSRRKLLLAAMRAARLSGRQ